MSFDSGVSACRRTGAALAMVAVAALAAGPLASADDTTTVEAQTQSASTAHLASQRAASYDPGDLLPARAGTDGRAAPVADASRTTGRTQSLNPGTAGQCTWGAAQKWFEASGSYPALTGDALSWGDAAKAAGWTVADDARDRSIVVFKPGVAGAGSIGHVAWVDSVSDTADGRWIHVTEMNNSYYGGEGIFNDRDIKAVAGMSYILLP